MAVFSTNFLGQRKGRQISLAVLMPNPSINARAFLGHDRQQEHAGGHALGDELELYPAIETSRRGPLKLPEGECQFA
jgi:hypothetical protein